MEENRRRDKRQPEFELLDTGVFYEDRYFDVFVEYAKADVEVNPDGSNGEPYVNIFRVPTPSYFW